MLEFKKTLEQNTLSHFAFPRQSFLLSIASMKQQSKKILQKTRLFDKNLFLGYARIFLKQEGREAAEKDDDRRD